MAGYAVAHLDEIEEFADAGCHYRPIRHHLGITAFGVTAWTARAASFERTIGHAAGTPSFVHRTTVMTPVGQICCELG